MLVKVVRFPLSIPFFLVNKDDNLLVQIITYFISIIIVIIISELYIRRHPLKVAIEGDSIYIYSIFSKSCYKINELCFINPGKDMYGMQGTNWGRVYKIGIKHGKKSRVILFRYQEMRDLDELVTIIHSKLNQTNSFNVE